jgi:hypothetical protein
VFAGSVGAVPQPPQRVVDLTQRRLGGDSEGAGDLQPGFVGRGDSLRGVRSELVELLDAETSLLVQFGANG